MWMTLFSRNVTVEKNDIFPQIGMSQQLIIAG
jgi:hypothetical protein